MSRFILDKTSRGLTHVVVDTGILRSGEALWKGGWGMSHDRIVPRGVMAHSDAAAERVQLTMTADEFRELAVDYIVERFERIPDAEPGQPDLSDLARIATSIPGEPGPYLMYDVEARSPAEVEITRDSPVWRLKPHQKIGEVEHVILDEDGRVSDLVVRRGFLFTHEVLLPMRWVVEVITGIVRVEIDDAALAELREFHDAS